MVLNPARLQNKHRVAMLVWFWRLPVALPLWPPPTQEQETAQASEQHCVQLEKARRELERQFSSVSERLQEEEACSAQLAIYRDRLEAECSSLRRDVDELENALTGAEHDRQVDFFFLFWSSHGKMIWCGLSYWEKIAHKTHTKGMRHLNLTIFVGKRHNLRFKHLLGASKKA